MQLGILDKLLKFHGLLKIPMMTPRERRLYKELLVNMAKERGFLNIFEYGCGYSTLYFSKFLKSKGINFHWHSLDNHAGWFKRAEAMIDEAGLSKQVTLHLSPFIPFFEDPTWKEDQVVKPGRFSPKSPAEKAYIQWPLSVKELFDVVIVDGRFRRRCLEAVIPVVKEDAVVILHDAERVFYHTPVQNLPVSTYIDGGKFYPFEPRLHHVWLGSKKAGFLAKVLSAYPQVKY